jgi:hypothetical protein
MLQMSACSNNIPSINVHTKQQALAMVSCYSMKGTSIMAAYYSHYRYYKQSVSHKYTIVRTFFRQYNKTRVLQRE